MKKIETIIVGGGQAGLATSYCLSKHEREHLVLEQSDNTASSWRNRCWDSFTLVTPNWAFKIPGIDLGHTHRDEFMPRKMVIEVLENYATRNKLPIKYNTEVLSITQGGDQGYVVQTPRQTYAAKNVVIATGFFQKPKIPAFAGNLASTIRQIHSSEYRNTGSVGRGSTLVVGSGQSGAQVAEELLDAGRHVFLSVGTAGRAPRRYRGRDIIDWLLQAGFFDLTPDQLPPGMGKFGGVPHLSGANGGHTINLHQLAHDGVTLLGRVRDASATKVSVAGDLFRNLEISDGFESDVTRAIDELIAANGLDAPPEQLPQLRYGFDQPIIEELDLEKDHIDTIVWATGYTFDYSLVKLPVFDHDGFPKQRSEIADFPGLFFVGVPWMPSEKTGFLIGVGDVAKGIAATIAGVHQPEPTPT